MSMVSISIDVTLVDKARLKEFGRRDGSKGKSLELILIETPNGKFGDFMIKQQVTKEEREARIEMPILGNGKILGGSRTPKPPPRDATASTESDEDIPF